MRAPGILPSALLLAVALASPVRAQEKLEDVVTRMGDYIASYQVRLASVVAEEEYKQRLETALDPSRTPGVSAGNEYGPGDRLTPTPGGGGVRERTLRSDYALVRPDGYERWVGFRDTFQVDGLPVRDREERLQKLLRTGAYAQAARIAEQNSRYNLGTEFVERNINVPTFVLELLQARYRDRFSFKRSGIELVGGRRAMAIEFRERSRPTIVKMPGGRDQASRGTVLVDPVTGEVLKTTVQFERVSGVMSVTYGLAPGIEVPVPIEMTERYTHDRTVISGRATYSNYRTFQTSGRIIDPR